MGQADHHDDTRRALLVRMLAAGLLSAVPGAFAGQVPRQMPAGRSIYSLQGSLTINGAHATPDSVIRPNDLLKTGPKSQAIFVVGQDAFTLRENSELQLSGDNLLVGGLRLVTGALLSVFGKTPHNIQLATATIGIRGTGVYAETDPDLSYICTCYGITEIASSTGEKTTVESRHHDAAKYVTAKGEILPARFINHTDEELMLIETLVGRTPPFALFDDSYGGPKRY